MDPRLRGDDEEILKTCNSVTPPEEAGCEPLLLDQFHAPAVCQVSAAIQARFVAVNQPLSGCTNDFPDPAKEVAFNNNAIPASLLDANAQALLTGGGKYGGIFPAPNSGSSFIGGNNLPTNVREEIIRIDENLSPKLSVFGHLVAEQNSQDDGTTTQTYFVAGGFVEVANDKVLVLADLAEPVSTIDVEGAKRRIAQAQEKLKGMSSDDAQFHIESATVKRETNSWKYPVIMAAYLFALAYVGSWITFRVATALS